MKLKFVSILLLAGLLLGISAPAQAQKSLSAENKYKGWEFNAGISAVPYLNILVYALSSLGHPNEKVDGNPGPEIGLPAGLDLQARYNFNRWLSVGGVSSIQYFAGPDYHDMKDSDGNVVKDSNGNAVREYGGMHSMLAASLMPDLRITYYKARRFSVYSQGAIGVVLYAFDKRCNQVSIGYPTITSSDSSGDGSGSDSSSFGVSFPFQTAPLGFTFGSKWYFYLQAEYGVMTQGATAGVGYRL